MEIKDFYSTKSLKTVRFKPQNWKSFIEHFKLSLSKCPSKPNTHSPYGQPNPTQNSLANSKYTQEADLISWPQIDLTSLFWCLTGGSLFTEPSPKPKFLRKPNQWFSVGYVLNLFLIFFSWDFFAGIFILRFLLLVFCFCTR